MTVFRAIYFFLRLTFALWIATWPSTLTICHTHKMVSYGGVKLSLLLLLLNFAFCTTCFGGPVSSLNDIEFWVGSGANQAALLLDWDGEATGDQSLAWGYRWDGAATGEDMLRDVLAADTRLFAKISAGGPAGIAFYGTGYDLNDDCMFTINDGTAFNSAGIAVTGPADLATSDDSGDLYAEGWFLGFWLLGQAATSPFEGGAWAQVGSGLSGLNLVDGQWTSLAFTNNTFSTTSFAQNPVSAAPPVPNADFNSDDDVDGIDFLAWQRGFGIEEDATHGQGDANHDCEISEADFNLWKAEFGLPASSSLLVGATFAVPEPTSLLLSLLGVGVMLIRRRKLFCMKCIYSECFVRIDI